MSGTGIFDSSVAAPGSGAVFGPSTAAHNPALAQQRLAQAQGMQNAAQSQMLAQQYTAAMSRNQHQWMVDGKTMNFEEFLDTICPDQDDPQRTFLILKYKK